MGKTLQELTDELDPERRERVEARAAALAVQERSRRFIDFLANTPPLIFPML